jgi:hypothetical protein
MWLCEGVVLWVRVCTCTDEITTVSVLGWQCKEMGGHEHGGDGVGDRVKRARMETHRVARVHAVPAVDGSDNSGNEDGTSDGEASRVGRVACSGGCSVEGVRVSACLHRNALRGSVEGVRVSACLHSNALRGV